MKDVRQGIRQNQHIYKKTLPGEFNPLDEQDYREYASKKLSASEKEAEEKNKERGNPRSSQNRRYPTIYKRTSE